MLNCFIANGKPRQGKILFFYKKKSLVFISPAVDAVDASDEVGWQSLGLSIPFGKP